MVKEYSQITKDAIKNADLTESDVQGHFDAIDNLTQFEMARMWRFMPSGHIYFNGHLPFFKYFEKRFKALGGMTSEISKALG